MEKEQDNYYNDMDKRYSVLRQQISLNETRGPSSKGVLLTAIMAIVCAMIVVVLIEQNR